LMSNIVTSCPINVNWSQTWLPKNPEPPKTNTLDILMINIFNEKYD
jgi:hypothetical protein